MANFALRIFITNHYLSKPLKNIDQIYNDFTNKPISQVPIIRVFGSTPKGQKVCAHIHGVFPYFYVPFSEDISILLNKERLDKYLFHFASSLSYALNLSFKGNNITKDHSYVYRVTLVKGKPFYGYQNNVQYFLKIYLYNPFHMKKAGDLLLNGAVMNRPMQPYETHIPYNLKFFIDYNLYGMNYLYTDAAMFRVNKNYLPEGSFVDLDLSDTLDLSQKTWNIDQLPLDCIMDERYCSKLSHCELEIDICGCDILNIHEVQKNIGANPGLKDLWDEEKQRRLDLGLDLSDLVGEVFEERPKAMHKESEISLLKEWEEICNSVKHENITNHQNIDEFINSSLLLDENTAEPDFSKFVNEESIRNTLKMGDSFVIEADNSKSELTEDDDRDINEFINACIKMEEEDSIMSDRQAQTTAIEVLAQKCQSFTQCSGSSQHFSTIVKENSDSDEDLFDQTIIDLSLDDSNEEEIIAVTETREILKSRENSEDLFEDISMDIDLDSDDSDKCIMMSYDGADDKDSDIEMLAHANKHLKKDIIGYIRSPIVTRSRPKMAKESISISVQNKKPTQTRKKRPSLKLKKDFPISQTLVTYIAETSNLKSRNDKNSEADIIAPNKKTFLNISEEISNFDTSTVNKDLVTINSCTIDLTRDNLEDIPKRKQPSQSRNRLSLKLKEPTINYSQESSNCKSPLRTIVSQTNPSKNLQHSVRPTFSTPSRSHVAEINRNFCDISPILKSSSTNPKRQRMVSFSIQDVSQESPHSSPLKSIQLPIPENSQLDILEFMKKTLSQSLHEISTNTNFLSQRFQSSMMAHLTLMSAEIHCNSRSSLKPDPAIDPVLMFFYSIHYETDLPQDNRSSLSVYEEGVVYVNDGGNLLTSTGIPSHPSYRTIGVTTELELLNEIIKIVMKFDPDILIGYETTLSSWGYVLQRSFYLKHKLYNGLGRLLNDERINLNYKNNNDEYNLSELHCTGRIILDLWVVLKYELTLTSYTLENAVDDVLKERVPLFTNQQLMAWYRSNLQRYKVVNYWKYRALANLRLLGKIGTINRTSEFAKIYGIEFYHVLSRGSQYRVEAMMLRLAKPQNLIAISPSVQQRARQKAPECIPLTLEPQSGFYKDPVVVLDFQSLYPSIMIAYNYCFSTSLGKLNHIRNVKIGDSFEFGCAKLNLDENTINQVGENVNISPNEVLFVKPQICKGIISKMVDEILNTRIMVKKSMKIHKNNKPLCEQLDSRQLGLKLIANVTFGYTAASYSGRMPCVEVGDSIIRKSRETLEESIQFVNNGGPNGYPLRDSEGGWEGCKVIYGDTDSLFILMPGRTKKEAFSLGSRIADEVTARNPFPVKLKFEKVFLPCLLESKKRYVGYSYESMEQEDPKFDAKGIETVRRDNCNIVSKILERTLVRMFTSENMDSIKRYVTSELDKVLSGKVNMTDFIIAKEYRGRKSYQPGASIPALHIANEIRKKDIRAEPLPGQRVQYVIVQGAPGDTLLSCVRQPCDLLFNTKLINSYGNNIRSSSEQGCKLSYIYYITKQILPPLNRALSLVGVNVFKWYSQMPKQSNVAAGSWRRQGAITNLNRTISSYFRSQKCILCNTVIKHSTSVSCDNMSSVLCEECLRKGASFIYYCGSKQIKDIEDVRLSFLKQCYLCSNSSIELKGVGPPCVSTDCPSLFDRIRAFQEPTEHLETLLQSNIF